MITYLRSLKIGNLTIENNLLQAPLAGYSGMPFRVLTWRLGRPGLLATEMLSANSLIVGNPVLERYLYRSDEEGPVQYQLWGSDPKVIGEATKILTDRGADVIDLNCGCPVRKVRAGDAGSKLMEDPSRIAAMVAQMRGNTDRPVTVKIRVGIGPHNFNGVEVARAAESEGVDLITVHGRHTREAYGTPVRYEEIARVVDAVMVPVVGNGDVADGETARKMFEETGCAGVMVGRACMGAPWVFQKIREELAGNVYTPPSRQQIGRTLLEHHDLLVQLIGPDQAIRHCRKLGSFYSKYFPGAKAFRGNLNFCLCREDLARLVGKYFELDG